MKPIENIYTKVDAVISPLYNIFGDNMTFYNVLPYTNTNFNNYSASNLWSRLSMYNEISYNITNTSIFNGGLLNSSFQDIPDAFWNNGMIVASFGNDTYRTQLDGYNFGIKIPLNSSYSGMTSGLTATTLYSAFIWSNDGLTTDPTSLCAGTIQDGIIAERSVQFTDGIGVGVGWDFGDSHPFSKGNVIAEKVLNNNGYHNSGIAYLVTDDIYQSFTGGTGSTLSWNYGFGIANKYAIGIGARSINTSFANTNNKNVYDSIVGMVNLSSGMVYIWNKDLVSGFDWTSFVGDPLTGSTTSSGTTYAVVQDIDESVSLNIDILARPGEWQSTTNPSTIGTNCGTVVTNICLYASDGTLIGLGRPSSAISLPENGYTPINLVVPISGPINETGIWSSGLVPGFELACCVI